MALPAGRSRERAVPGKQGACSIDPSGCSPRFPFRSTGMCGSESQNAHPLCDRVPVCWHWARGDFRDIVCDRAQLPKEIVLVEQLLGRSAPRRINVDSCLIRAVSTQVDKCSRDVPESAGGVLLTTFPTHCRYGRKWQFWLVSYSNIL